MMARAASPPAARRVASRCAGSGLRVGKLSPPPIAAKKWASPRSASSTRAAFSGLLVQTANRHPAVCNAASVSAVSG